jgi:hypothetical protein
MDTVCWVGCCIIGVIPMLVGYCWPMEFIMAWPYWMNPHAHDHPLAVGAVGRRQSAKMGRWGCRLYWVV